MNGNISPDGGEGNPCKDCCEKKWFALYTKPRHEFKAEEQLSEAGIDYYLPSIIREKQWSDRKKKIREPLIRGYIFICASEKDRLNALQKDAVVSCIAFDGRAAVIPDWQIQNLKKMLSINGDFEIMNKIAAGTKVKIISGPFEGVIGMVNDTPSGKTISITIDLLNRSVTALLPTDSIVQIQETIE